MGELLIHHLSNYKRTGLSNHKPFKGIFSYYIMVNNKDYSNNFDTLSGQYPLGYVIYTAERRFIK